MQWQNGMSLFEKDAVRCFLYESMTRFTISLPVHDGLMAPSLKGFSWKCFAQCLSKKK